MSKEKIFSFTRGYSFSFEDEGNEIQAWFSTLSGLEKVYVDGELVSSQRNLSADSSNVFSIDQNEYTTDLKVASLLKGPFVCTLSKNGIKYKRKKLIFPRLQSKSSKFLFLVRFIFFIVLGCLVGLSMSYFQPPQESIYYFISAIFFVVFFYHLTTHKGSGPVI